MQHPILTKVLSDIELRNYSEATKDVYLRTVTVNYNFANGTAVVILRLAVTWGETSAQVHDQGAGA